MNLSISRIALPIALAAMVAHPGSVGAQQAGTKKASFSVCNLPAQAMESGCGAFYGKSEADLRKSSYVFASSKDSVGLAVCVDDVVHILQPVAGPGRSYADDQVTVRLNVKFDKIPDPLPNEMESVGAKGRMRVIYKGSSVTFRVIGFEGC